jgi:hypothetical protein
VRIVVIGLVAVMLVAWPAAQVAACSPDEAAEIAIELETVAEVTDVETAADVTDAEAVQPVAEPEAVDEPPTPVGPTAWPVPDVLAESYIRALYAGDMDTQRALFPSSEPTERDEQLLTLEALTVQPLTREQYGDSDPLSQSEYVRVITTFSYEGRTGMGDYLVVLHPSPDADENLVVSTVQAQFMWLQPPAA